MVWGTALLNDAKIKAARPRETAYKLADSGQLYLHVTPAGGKHWRMNYMYGGKQKTLTFGPYPAVSLLDARKRRDGAKDLLRLGRDPAVEKRVQARAQVAAAENTFEAVARRWHGKKAPRWSAVHAADVLALLDRDIFPHIGDLPIVEIRAPKLLEVLTRVEERGAIETAHRLRQYCSAVFVFGIAAGTCEVDPAASLGKALTRKPPARPQASIVDRLKPEDMLPAVRTMLADCEAMRTRAGTKLAMRLIALTAVRPNEVRMARWTEIEGINWATGDTVEPLWRIPAARMKGDEERKAEATGDHLVPLAPAAVDVLLALHRLTGDLALMFPGERHLHRPMSENTLNQMLIRAGYGGRHVPHGWRAAFSTIMNERAKAAGRDGDRAVIDLMLAHVPKDKVEGAYNRAAFMARRRELAEEWAELVLDGFEPAEVLLGLPMRQASRAPKRTWRGRPTKAEQARAAEAEVSQRSVPRR